jgi:hypothetical protein
MANWHTKKVIRTLSGYLIAEEIEGQIRIYGDPEGLRSFGQAVISIADLDQSSLDDRECPPDDSFHQHYNLYGKTGPIRLLTVGRVDEKASGKIRDCFRRT